MVAPRRGVARQRADMRDAVSSLDTLIETMDETYEAIQSMPVLDREQQALMDALVSNMEATNESVRALSYRIEIFMEKGII